MPRSAGRREISSRFSIIIERSGASLRPELTVGERKRFRDSASFTFSPSRVGRRVSVAKRDDTIRDRSVMRKFVTEFQTRNGDSTFCLATPLPHSGETRMGGICLSGEAIKWRCHFVRDVLEPERTKLRISRPAVRASVKAATLSACAIAVDRGDRFHEEYRGNGDIEGRYRWRRSERKQ